MRLFLSGLVLALLTPAILADTREDPQPFPGTAPLTLPRQTDFASLLVEGVDKFLLKELEHSVERRARHWKRDLSSADAYQRSLESNRKHLAHILGVRDARIPFTALTLDATTRQPSLVGKGANYEIHAVRWPAFAGVHGEGLLLQPTTGKPHGIVIALPDADQTPEQLVGLMPGTVAEAQYARRLAESGYQVIVPLLISREIQPRNNRSKLTHREFLYRPAFELGRHLIGYEVQKILALVDWSRGDAETRSLKIGVVGWGEGGLLALYAAALDGRIDSVLVSGYFDKRNTLWQEPIDRNVFALLDEFGDAELATMIAPRPLLIEAARAPQVTIPPGLGGGPGRILTPKVDVVREELARARRLLREARFAVALDLVLSGEGNGPPGSADALQRFLAGLGNGHKLAPSGTAPRHLRPEYNPAPRLKRQLEEIDQHTQNLLETCAEVRKQYMNKLDTKSLAAYEKSIASYREQFANEVIGRFEYPLAKPNPRSSRIYEKEKWTGYEVVLDVYPGVIAYGVLLMPRDIKKGEKRPVVVCQHGLEGRPKDVIEGNHPAYHDYAAKLAERGFITFAPQNLYIFQDRFRTLQRKANPLRKTLFSVIVPQHQQIVNWLKSLPEVDSKRIAFYGLSYGGKTAMRVPALVPDYCLSICSADFNEWVWKNASTRSPYSYVWSMEYEIFEFDLGNTFNYAEMAALIAPRPFMVERGHFDGVAPDEKVAHEFAKVRFHYEARLGLKDQCAIEWFVGPHTINGKGTFEFLHQHLNWPRR